MKRVNKKNSIGRTVVERSCLQCKSTFYVPPCLVKNKGKHKSLYCSKRCNALMNGFKKGNSIGVGEKNGNWKGGKTRLTARVRSLREYYLWRKDIFKRDNYSCVLCKKVSEGDIEADHIDPMALILSFYKIESIEEIKECNPLWNISNGRTLCKECHKNTPTYASKYYSFIKLT